MTSVLFLCQHNAGRSQLGAYLFAQVAGPGYEIGSAGNAPAETINPVVAASLAEIGIDTSTASPRAVTVEQLASVDVVVAMKPRLDLPGPVAGRFIEWQFPDPSAWDLDGVRELRDAVLEQVRRLAEELADDR